jgi:hypothetical protein
MVFTLKYACVEDVVGRDMARKVEAVSHLHAGKLAIYRAAPMCTGQRAVKSSLRRVTRVGHDGIQLTCQYFARCENISEKLFIFVSNDVMNFWERKTTSSTSRRNLVLSL